MSQYPPPMPGMYDPNMPQTPPGVNLQPAISGDQIAQQQMPPLGLPGMPPPMGQQAPPQGIPGLPPLPNYGLGPMPMPEGPPMQGPIPQQGPPMMPQQGPPVGPPQGLPGMPPGMPPQGPVPNLPPMSNPAAMQPPQQNPQSRMTVAELTKLINESTDANWLNTTAAQDERKTVKQLVANRLKKLSGQAEDNTATYAIAGLTFDQLVAVRDILGL